MRLRKKPNLVPRLEACASVLVREAPLHRGRWRELLPGCLELHAELGCGRARFTVETAKTRQDVLFVAIERLDNVLVTAAERVLSEKLENVLLIGNDAAKLEEYFAEGELDRLYINFCDPWPKERHAKRRLTAPGFLRVYEKLLAPGGELHFKTDNSALFAWSAEQLEAEGWQLSERTDDLHANGPCGVMTDYEQRFYAEGVPIHRLVARKH